MQMQSMSASLADAHQHSRELQTTGSKLQRQLSELSAASAKGKDEPNEQVRERKTGVVALDSDLSKALAGYSRLQTQHSALLHQKDWIQACHTAQMHERDASIAALTKNLSKATKNSNCLSAQKAAVSKDREHSQAPLNAARADMSVPSASERAAT